MSVSVIPGTEGRTMLRLARFAFLGGFMLFTAGCDDDDLLNSSNLTPVTLDYRETAYIEALDLYLTFSALIEDSRCPIGADCFWIGEATIQARVVDAARDTFYVTLPIIGGQPTPDSRSLQPVDAGGYRFTLMTLEPYPQVDTMTILVAPIIPPDTTDEAIIISDLPPMTIQRQPWVFDTTFVDGDDLNLTVRYGGGCREHYFNVFMSPAAFFESYPVQANLYVRHESLFDPCEAMITEDLTFSLRPVIELYRRHYGRDDDILLNIYHSLDSSPWQKTTVRYIVPGNR